MARRLREARVDLVRDVDHAVIDIAPLRGLWTVEQYLALTDATAQLVEFVDNTIELLPMPTDRHQTLLEYLFLALRGYIVPRGGKVLFAALRLEVSAGRFREPDLLLMRDAHDPRRQDRYWRGADLVAEIVSPDDPERDTIDKVADYAAAGIAEYWIVNPLDATVTVLRLAGTRYTEHGVFRPGERATSALLDGVVVDVAALLAAR